MTNCIDLGCGPKKIKDAYGVDCYQYEGVDQVFDLNMNKWPLESDQFNVIYARHVIEHIEDIKHFMNEIHRIGKKGAIVNIETPHFSSIHSWQDPTHKWHLASKWYKPFTEQYLSEQVSAFNHKSTQIKFSSGSFGGIMAKLLIKIIGTKNWEKKYSFIIRARNIKTVLEIIK